MTSSSVWTSVVARCHASPSGGSVRFFFFANGDCSSGVHWFVLGAVVEPAMHVSLWDAKGNQLYMRPLIHQLCDKGIPLTAKALGFQNHDGWTRRFESLSLLW